MGLCRRAEIAVGVPAESQNRLLAGRGLELLREFVQLGAGLGETDSWTPTLIVRFAIAPAPNRYVTERRL
jgi:hypothetical protein